MRKGNSESYYNFFVRHCCFSIDNAINFEKKTYTNMKNIKMCACIRMCLQINV